MKKTLGFIGLGNMGAPMAGNLLKKFGNLTVYNRSQEPCKKLEVQGAVAASSVEDLAARTDVIFLSLPGPVQVEEVVARGLLANGHAGQCIVDLSTVSPKLGQNLAKAAAEKGIFYVDVPVSGGPTGAAKGSLTLMIGATAQEILDKGLLPYLETLGSVLHYTGKRGGGSAIKIINNYMAFAAQIINGEAILMADHIGISLDTFYTVTTSSSGNNAILTGKRTKVESGDTAPGFALDLVVKDLELARQLCEDCKIPNFSLNLGLQFYRMAQQMGYGAKDSSSVIKMIRELQPPQGSEN